MTPYVLSPLAQRDLEDIWAYSEDRWGSGQAERYIRTIQQAIENAAANARRDRPCDEIRVGYFKLSVGSHILFYRRFDGVMDVMRILHQRMDFDLHL